MVTINVSIQASSKEQLLNMVKTLTYDYIKDMDKVKDLPEKTPEGSPNTFIQVEVKQF